MYEYIESSPKLRLALKRKQNQIAWGGVICWAALGVSVIWGYGKQTVEALNLTDVKLCSLTDVICSYEAQKPNLRLTDTIYEVLSTGYTSRIEETDGSPCIAADGTDICKRYENGEGICAANWLPLGTKIFVEGYGTCTVADRMAKKNSEKLDVYFGYDLEAALEWGRRWVKVYAQS